jgi:hypothetical protein
MMKDERAARQRRKLLLGLLFHLVGPNFDRHMAGYVACDFLENWHVIALSVQRWIIRAVRMIPVQ